MARRQKTDEAEVEAVEVKGGGDAMRDAVAMAALPALVEHHLARGYSPSDPSEVITKIWQMAYQIADGRLAEAKKKGVN